MKFTPFILATLITLVSSTPLYALTPVPLGQFKTAQILQIGRSIQIGEQFLSTWPASSFKTQFSGKQVGFRIEDLRNAYLVYIDGIFNQRINPQDTPQEIWVKNLKEQKHELLLVKVTENTTYAGKVGPFFIKEGAWLATPLQSPKQIEFIGDSWTAALGNLSDVRECSYDESVQKTDITQGFAYLTAQKWGADFQILGMSGMGVNRNWNGNQAEVNYRTFYNRTIQFDSTIIYKDSTWNPQVYVIGLGINDFSTALNPGEKWTDSSLAFAYKTELLRFIKNIRIKSPKAHIILSKTYLWPKDQLRPFITEIADSLIKQGDSKIHTIEYTDLELKGCMWHPNRADHIKMSNVLIKEIESIQELKK